MVFIFSPYLFLLTVLIINSYPKNVAALAGNARIIVGVNPLKNPLTPEVL